uniref:Uncharacterized protein n=1 Tax=Caenorhabditis japonica TaxID=281687 RepID=A0A8R1E756_CAEJA
MAFTKCVLNRIQTTLEEAQSIEQPGFRRFFSTMDYIDSIQRMLKVGSTRYLANAVECCADLRGYSSFCA